MTDSTRNSSPAGMRLYCMSSGTLRFDQGVFTHMQGVGTPTRVPTPFFLIDHPQGKVLFETGMHSAVAVDAAAHWGERAIAWAPEMAPEQTAVRQLARLGVRPEEIRFVVLSCLLPDHAGGAQDFMEATFVVQFRELQDAWWPDRRLIRSYDFRELLPTRGFRYWELHDEDLDLFGDSSVVVMFCPAHTRGEQALVVRLPSTGTVVLPAGIIPQRANLERGVMTGTPRVDPAVVHASMARLAHIVKQENAMVIFHHDAEAWREIRHAPEYYD